MTKIIGEIYGYDNEIKRDTPSLYEIKELVSYDKTKEWWFCIQFSPMGFNISEFIKYSNGRDWNADIGHKISFKYTDINEILIKHNFVKGNG
jgi:hypothetical protein